MKKHDEGYCWPKYVVFWSKDITSNSTYIVVFLTAYPLISLYTHNGDGTLQSFHLVFLYVFMYEA